MDAVERLKAVAERNPEFGKALDAFLGMTLDQKVEMHNRYCLSCDLIDDIIDDFGYWYDNELKYADPQTAFRWGVMSGPFSFSDKYIMFDGNGNIKSTCDPFAAGWLHTIDMLSAVADNGDATKDPCSWFGGADSDEY